jgi:hypothetical protein
LPPRDKAYDYQHRNCGVGHYVNESRTQVMIAMDVMYMMRVMVVRVGVIMLMIVIIAQKIRAE